MLLEEERGRLREDQEPARGCTATEGQLLGATPPCLLHRGVPPAENLPAK